MKHSLNTNIRLLYAFTFCMNCVFMLPVIVPYYKEQLDLTFQDFLLGEMGFAAVIFLAEVPTGLVADRWGRKHSILLGMGIYIIGWLMLLLAGGFWSAFFAQSILGLAVALISSTIGAILYDHLLSNGREAEFQKLEGRRHGLGLYVVAASAIIGGFLYRLHPQLPIIAIIIFAVIGFIIMMGVDEPVRHKQSEDKHPLRDMLETVQYALHGHKEVAVIILLSSLIFGSTKLFLWLQQPYSAALHIPETLFGMALAASMFLGGTGGQLGHYLKRGTHIQNGRLSGLYLLFSFTCLLAFAAAWLMNYIGLGLLFLSAPIFGAGWPWVQDLINTRIPSARRATIISTCSLGAQIVFFLLSPIIGWVEKDSGISASLYTLAGIQGTVLLLICISSFYFKSIKTGT